MQEYRSFLVALIIVVLAALVAALLFVAALILWLAELMGSIIYPCLLVGVFLSLLTFIVYKVSLGGVIREMHERIGVIYDVTKSLRECVEWVVKLLFRKF